MNTSETIQVTAMGHVARQVLRRNPFALVSGTSSQGIYLQPIGDLTLFLTPQPFRGPLTINLRRNWDSLLPYQPGCVVNLGDDELTFSDPHLSIQIKGPLIWKPSQPPYFQRQTTNQFTKLISRVQKKYSDHPWRNLLDIVAADNQFSFQEFPGLADHICSLSEALAIDNHNHILSDMKLILGSGPGLTPLGDDLVLGILLAIVRTRRQVKGSEDLIRNSHTVISAAEEKTTTVSWSILSCAIQESADERIIRVLDKLIAAQEIPDHDLENLIEWGSSSGMAVLAGMLMVLA